MKITHVETLRADAGWRMLSFLKLTISDGIIGLSDVNKGLSPVLIGRDPSQFEQVTQHLHVLPRQSRGGLNQQAIAAIENGDFLLPTGPGWGNRYQREGRAGAAPKN